MSDNEFRIEICVKIVVNIIKEFGNPWCTACIYVWLKQTPHRTQKRARGLWTVVGTEKIVCYKLRVVHHHIILHIVANAKKTSFSQSYSYKKKKKHPKQVLEEVHIKTRPLHVPLVFSMTPQVGFITYYYAVST